MNIFSRFSLSIVICSIIYPVTILHAGKTLPEIQRRRRQKAYGFQKMPRQTKAQKIAERKYETKENRARLQAQYDIALRETIKNQRLAQTAPVKTYEITLSDGRTISFLSSSTVENNNFIDLTK